MASGIFSLVYNNVKIGSGGLNRWCRAGLTGYVTLLFCHHPFMFKGGYEGKADALLFKLL